MKRRRGIFFFTLMILTLLTACETAQKLNDRDADIYTRIHNQYVRLSSYTAEVTLTVRSNKTENVYQCRQFYAADNKYRTELLSPDTVSGLVTIINGDRAYTGLPDGQDYTFEQLSDQTSDILFIDQFFANYYKSEETAIHVTGQPDETRYTVLQTDVIGQNARSYTMSLAIDNDTLLPHKLSVYDMGGQETVTAEYRNVKLNEALDESLFVIKQA